MRSEFTSTTTEKSPLLWSRWSPCSATCGEAVQFRISIEGETEQRKCNLEPCPTPIWSTWSTCSAECGPGVQTRTNGSVTEERNCTSKQCPSGSEYLFICLKTLYKIYFKSLVSYLQYKLFRSHTGS